MPCRDGDHRMSDSRKILQSRSKVPVLLLLATISVFVLLVVGGLWFDYQDLRRNAEKSARQLAVQLAVQIDDRFRRVDRALRAISSDLYGNVLGVSDMLRQNQARFDADLLVRKSELPGINGFHVCDADGDVVYSSFGVAGRSVNVSGRGYFQQLRDDPAPRAVLSPVLQSRFSGDDVVVVARGLRGANGVFQGAVFGTVRVEELLQRLIETYSERNEIISLRQAGNEKSAVWYRGEVVSAKGLSDTKYRFVEVAVDLPALIAPGKALSDRRADSERLEAAVPYQVFVGMSRDDVLSGWFVRVSAATAVFVVVIGLVVSLVGRLRRMRLREARILGDLALREAQFGSLAQLVPVGICCFDAAGKCSFVNDRFLSMAGKPKVDLIGRKWFTLICPDDRAKLSSLWKDGFVALNGMYECRLLGAGGTQVHVVGDIRDERGDDGAVRGYVVAVTDISRQKLVEVELADARLRAEQANKAKARFLAVASHDLRQPIQAINLFKDALIRSGLTGEQQAVAGFLSLSVSSLSELLYALLDFSKLDAGMVQPQKRLIDVEEIFKAVDEMFSSIAQQRNLRFKFSYPLNGFSIFTDPGLLLSVLRNLIDNAFKYTESGGVLVGVRRRSTQFVVQVWDTGIGVPADVGEKIFEECYQIDNPKRDRARGIGIGLSIARRTARLLGGDVLYRSRAGKGSVFEMVLPLNGPSGECADSQRLPRGLAIETTPVVDCSIFSGWRIVVVEDDPVVAKSIELSLLALDMEVDVFGSAEEAIASPRLLGGDFYISDYILPGANGVSLLDSIQERSSSPIRALLMTGETSPERMSGIQSLRWRVLFKPADLSRILTIMNDVVREDKER